MTAEITAADAGVANRYRAETWRAAGADTEGTETTQLVPRKRWGAACYARPRSTAWLSSAAA